MKPITLQVESYLFENGDSQFRAIPFYELSIDEWVIYQNKAPRYLIDFNRIESPFIQHVKEEIQRGFSLEKIINACGVYLGLEWTTEHNIEGEEVEGSQIPEKVNLEVIESFGDIAHELIFIATDSFDSSVLLDEDEMIERYMVQDENGFYGLESFIIDRAENVYNLIHFVFQADCNLELVHQSGDVSLYDLSSLMGTCIDMDMLENVYQDWITLSGRANNMDEYGNLLGLVGFVDRNSDKKQLMLRVMRKEMPPVLFKVKERLETTTNSKPTAKRSWWKRLWS
jgi:hypothetical protein